MIFSTYHTDGFREIQLGPLVIEVSSRWFYFPWVRVYWEGERP